jgi:hypothetical protein
MSSEIQSEKDCAIYGNDSVEVGRKPANSVGQSLFVDAYSDCNHQQANHKQAQPGSAFDNRSTYFSAEARARSNEAAEADRNNQYQQLRQDKPLDLKRGVHHDFPTFLEGFEIELSK